MRLVLPLSACSPFSFPTQSGHRASCARTPRPTPSAATSRLSKKTLRVPHDAGLSRRRAWALQPTNSAAKLELHLRPSSHVRSQSKCIISGSSSLPARVPTEESPLSLLHSRLKTLERARTQDAAGLLFGPAPALPPPSPPLQIHQLQNRAAPLSRAPSSERPNPRSPRPSWRPPLALTNGRTPTHVNDGRE
ncbi:hypothetical protein C8J57DRAFT_1512374 [Mycena rebaudengoi]|nr:hypothetical protein C8J57DRAFT_1512374 [Mycena rebaudengoi]